MENSRAAALRYLALAAFAFSVFCVTADDVLRFTQNEIRFQANDKGQLTDCGDKKAMSTFSLDWSPKDIKFGDLVTVNADFVSGLAFSKGKACFDVWVAGVPDPILSDCTEINCENLQKTFNQFGLKLKCPLAKGDHYEKKNFSIKALPKIPIPQGSYKLAGNVTTDSGTPYLCAKGDLTVKVP